MKIKRPDWTKQIERKKSKIWVDKNLNCDEFIYINLSNIKKIKKNNIFESRFRKIVFMLFEVKT